MKFSRTAVLYIVNGKVPALLRRRRGLQRTEAKVADETTAGVSVQAALKPNPRLYPCSQMSSKFLYIYIYIRTHTHIGNACVRTALRAFFLFILLKYKMGTMAAENTGFEG